MKHRFASSLITLALATQAVAVSASVTGFRLPPAPTPTATPQVQGPVDIEGGRPTAPRAIPTTVPNPTPTPTPAPTLAPSPAPAAVPTTAQQPEPSASTARTPTAQPTARAQRSAAPQTGRQIVPDMVTPSAGPDLGATDVQAPNTSISLPTLPGPDEAQSGVSESAGPTNYTLWISLILGMVIVLGAALTLWPRRQAATAGAPEIEPPSKWVRQSRDSAGLPPLPSTPARTPSDSADVAEPPLVAPLGEHSTSKAALQVKAQALTLSRSLLNATFSYRLELMNLNASPITEISVKADLVTAHGQAPIGEQVADESTDLIETAFVASIDGRDTHEVKGSLSLPVNAIRPIAQRSAKLYVPLLRLRVDAVNADPIICTFVIGIKPPERSAKLQPFRLDEMAQTYREIGLRLLS